MPLHELICRWVRQTLDTASPWLLPLSVALIVVGLLLDRSLRRELGWYVRMPWFKKLFTTVAVVMFVRAAVPKGDGGNGDGHASSPRMMMRQLASAPESSPTYDGMFPAWTNAVTNVCITGMKLTDTSVVSRVHHPADILPTATGIAVYAMPSLASNVWSRIGTAPIAGGADGTIIEFPYSILPEGWLYSMFFRFALTDDFDGDELPDIAETGGIRQLGEYRYYDLNGATDWIANYAFSGTDIITLALPDEAVIAGEHYDRVSVDLHGIVYLIPVGGSAVTAASSLNHDLRYWDPGTTNLSVAAYWGDIVRSTYYPTMLRTQYVQSDDCFVIDYAAFTMNYFPYGWLSFQIVIPLSGDSDVIRVNYPVVTPGLEERNVTIGFMKSSVRSDNPGERNYCRQWRHNGGNAVASGMSLEFRIGTGTDPRSEDTDCDGLSDSAELLFGTNPRQPDTDGDGYDDGWECLHVAQGFDPLFPNTSASTGPDGDLDEDGLTNREECELGTDPNALDSDGDGVNDYVEIAQNSDPADGTDNGEANSRVAATFRFGDDSPSHSEKYRLEISPISGPGDRPRGYSWLDACYGVPETRRAMLKPGWKYEIRLEHAGTNPGYHDDPCPDYDYVLQFVGADSSPSVILDDPQGLFGGNDNSGESFTGEGKVAYLYVLGNPRLVFDYDRDGRIDDTDVAKAKDGKVFRFWINDDNDGGDTNDSANDVPGSGPNCGNDYVDGRCDLLDFTPVWIDTTEVFPPGTPPSVLNDVVWKVRSSCVNAVWSYADRGNAGAFQRQGELYDFGSTLADIPESAAVVTNFADGVLLPQVMMRAMRSDHDRGVFLIEGCADGTDLVVEGWHSAFSEPAVSNCANICIKPVEDMYRWLCLRDVCGNDDGLGNRLDNPSNWPDGECDGRHFVFVHGYNVNAQSARGWASEMFKRLWQSGSQSKFTAVDWYGDYSQIDVPVVGNVSPNYYQNVVHAFQTAPALKTACDALSGEKVLLAHSLGNMLTCAAIARHGLQYSKYYMLNAAVPVEAFDAEAEVQVDMKPLAWQRYSDDLFSCNWYDKFGVEDGRRSLTWRGIFAGVHDAVNCYSPTEDVLGNAPAVGVGGAWSAQELLKGSGTMDFMPRVRREGGWGFNPDHTVPLSQNNELLKTEYTEEEMITSPPFLPFVEDWLHSTNAVTATQIAEVRDRILADGIPALTFAAGANALSSASGIGSYNFQSETPNGWPRTTGVWRHSDLKDVAYFYVWKLFEKIRRGE